MEAKDYQGIIDTADCNPEVNYVDANGENKILGWAKTLIEISFRAGYNKSLAQLVNMTEECKQIGRKEVVEWVEENYGWLSGKWLGKDMTLSLAFDRWEAQLKEWGIKEEQ